MRGQDVARVNGWPFYSVEQLPAGERFEALILCKYDAGFAKSLRKACDRLIFDPLDCWMSEKPNAAPDDFWQWKYDRLKFDDILATSPACAETMQEALPGVRVHLLPHHADPRIDASWYDSGGPVVYAGGKHYIDRHLGDIERACRHIGRKFVGNFTRRPVDSLKGAALQLHPRFPPTDTALSRLCKPAVKIANSAAAGMPSLATPHPCVTSLDSGACLIDHHDNWERLLLRALESAPPARQPTLEEHAADLRKLIEK